MSRAEDILTVREKLGIRRKEFSDALYFTKEQEKMLKEWETGKIDVPDVNIPTIEVRILTLDIKPNSRFLVFIV